MSHLQIGPAKLVQRSRWNIYDVKLHRHDVSQDEVASSERRGSLSLSTAGSRTIGGKDTSLMERFCWDDCGGTAPLQFFSFYVRFGKL